MGLNFTFLLLAFIVCQVQFNSGGPPVTDSKKAILEEWVGTPFNEMQYEEALKQRNYFQSTRGPFTAKQEAKPFENFQWTDIEQLPDVTDDLLLKIFLFIRDVKVVKDEGGFEHTLNWRYPDSGCESRAELATRAILQKDMTIPKKVFVFGSPLIAANQNTDEKDKLISWNYHVALIYRVQRIPYVLDPTLNYETPLRLHEWDTAFSKNSNNLKYSICAPTTVTAEDNCYQCSIWPQHEVLRIQIPLLTNEVERVELLRKSARTELRIGTPFV